ncbi:MAG TPA: hypothetical protein DEH78_11535 [Solibacterales bacterium]|nr:hypothetical protein [Bryobacterales bacterium]
MAYEGRPTPLSSRTEAPLTTTIEAAAPAAAIAAPPAPRAAGPAEIALRLGGPRDQEIEIRVRENASAVDVVVRGRDPELTKDLRSQLGDLVARLEDRGYEAKTWIPGEPARAELRAEKPAAELASGGRDDSPNSRHEQQGQPGGRRDREQRQPRPHWLERFEHTFREEARQ